MCIVHNLYCGYSLFAYVIIGIIMIDQNKTFRSEKSARALPGQARVCRRLCFHEWFKHMLGTYFICLLIVITAREQLVGILNFYSQLLYYNHTLIFT